MGQNLSVLPVIVFGIPLAMTLIVARYSRSIGTSVVIGAVLGGGLMSIIDETASIDGKLQYALIGAAVGAGVSWMSGR